MAASKSGGIMTAVKDSPVTARLIDELKSYAEAKTTNLVGQLGTRMDDVTDQLNDVAENAGPLGKAGKEVAGKLAEGDSPVKAALSGATTGIGEKIKSAFGKGSGGGGGGKVTNIVEDIDIGAPVSEVYNQWTQFQEFPNFTKGVQSVEPTDEVESTWRFKIAKANRSVKATVTEQIPDRRIVWTSEGAKGSTKGVVTFHPLADDLTKVLLVLEYYPGGFVEKTGNIWRAAGRRARLDLKHFRRFVSMNGEATGSWRGEIRDGEVVSDSDEGGDSDVSGDGQSADGADEQPEQSGTTEDERERASA